MQKLLSNAFIIFESTIWNYVFKTHLNIMVNEKLSLTLGYPNIALQSHTKCQTYPY